MDLLLNRYSNIDYILEMYWQDAIQLINKAQEKIIEQKQWELYCGIYPNMDKKSFISFEKFIGKSKNKNENKTPKVTTNKEVLEKAEATRRKFEMQRKQKLI